MEAIPFNVEGSHFGVRDLDGFGILVFVEAALDVEPGPGGGCANQLNDDLTADKRLAAPILSDESEQPVLDAVPFAGAGGMMRDGDGKAGFVGEDLQFTLP